MHFQRTFFVLYQDERYKGWITTFWLASILFGNPIIQAQLCGSAFAGFTIEDSEGKSIPDVTIELIAEAPPEKYEGKMRDKSALKISLSDGVAVKVSVQKAKEIVKQSRPMSRATDFCENPLRQRASITVVKRRPSLVDDGGGSVKNFGYCTEENNFHPFLLKISAPGYVTDYYVGPFLGRCARTYKIVLTKK
jgi:hypothetical protein